MQKETHLGAVLGEDLGLLVLGSLFVEDAPVFAHEGGEGLLKLGVDHDFLEFGGDLVEEHVVGGFVQT